MKIQADYIKDYLNALSDERQAAMQQLLEVIHANISDGFEETMQYHMPSFVVPHAIYPAGYHCKPSDPLPFISLASQKNFISLYHCGIYADDALLQWFQNEYPKHCKRKLDMGKSCIRFKYLDDIPYQLISILISKMTLQDWVTKYEQSHKS